MEKVQADKAAK
jgi:hypothetical protein